MKRTTVLCFGVFDRFHEGHEDFLAQVSKCGEPIVVVTPDCVVRRFKKHDPWQTAEVRATVLAERGFTTQLGDEIPGQYSILRDSTTRPDLICFGYDQNTLMDDVQRRMDAGDLPRIQTKVLGSSDPTIHTSTKYPRL